MIRLSLKYQIILFIAMMITGLGAVILGILRPAIQHILELKRSINVTERILEEQYQRTRYQRRTMRQLADVSEQVNKLQTAAVKRGAELTLITALEELAAQHRLQQSLNIAFTDAPPRPTALDARPSSRALQLPYYTVSVAVEGNFPAMLQYLKSLEELPAYVVIDNLIFEKKQEPNDLAMPLTLKFQGRVYASAP